MSRKGNRGEKPQLPHDDDVLQQTDVDTVQLTPEDSAEYNHEDKVNTTDVLRVHVATPAYDGKVDSDFASSMLMAGQLCSLNMIECSTALIGNGAFIEIARNVLVKEFLESDTLKHFTHFMFIDSDLQFEPRAISGLVRSGLPVSAGAYRRRQEPVSYPIRWTPLPKKSDKEPDRLWMNGGWLRCDRVPTGFLCITREVLEKMTERAIEEGRVVHLPDKGATPWLFYTKVDEQNRFVGEDFAWCDDYMQMHEEGIFDEPIWVWPDFDFVHGGFPCNYQHHLAEEVEKFSPKRRMGKRRNKA